MAPSCSCFSAASHLSLPVDLQTLNKFARANWLHTCWYPNMANRELAAAAIASGCNIQISANVGSHAGCNAVVQCCQCIWWVTVCHAVPQTTANSTTTTMIQAFHRAVQISVSLGACIWNPSYQGNNGRRRICSERNTTIRPYSPVTKLRSSDMCIGCHNFGSASCNIALPARMSCMSTTKTCSIGNILNNYSIISGLTSMS